MGSSTSKNYVDSVVESYTKITSDVAQECGTEINLSQLVSLGGSCKLTDVTFNWDQALVLDLKCAQNVIVLNKIKTKIEEALTQKASAEAALLGMGSTDAENFISLHKVLATEIKNSFLQNCATKNVQTQSFACADAAGAERVVFNWNQKSTLMKNCTQKARAVTDILEQIASTVAQHSSTNKFLWLAIGLSIVGAILLIVLAVYLYRRYQTSTKTEKKKTTATATPILPTL